MVHQVPSQPNVTSFALAEPSTSSVTVTVVCLAIALIIDDVAGCRLTPADEIVSTWRAGNIPRLRRSPAGPVTTGRRCAALTGSRGRGPSKLRSVASATLPNRRVCLPFRWVHGVVASTQASTEPDDTTRQETAASTTSFGGYRCLTGTNADAARLVGAMRHAWRATLNP